MFAMQRDRSSSGSSTRSLSLSPAGGWNPTRATISPATTTTTPLSSSPNENSDSVAPLPSKQGRSVGGLRRLESYGADAQYSSCSYSCWPTGDSLSSTSTHHSSTRHHSASTAYNPYNIPSSRISDDDLAELDFTRPQRREETVQEVGQVGISWSQVGTGAVAAQAQAPERKKRGPPPGALVMERRTSSRSVSKRSRMARTRTG